MVQGKISYMAIAGTPRLVNSVDLFMANSCKAGLISYDDLMSRKRHKKIVDVRHIVAYELNTRFMLDDKKTGNLLGINRATLYCARRKYNTLYQRDPEFKELADKIKKI
jgi:chromosomal replication initiation ATPase DnaA